MKYANKLTDKELKELYQLFTGSDVIIKELNIIKNNNFIGLEGTIEFLEGEEENSDTTIITDDDYEITDFEVKAYHHSGNYTLFYREWMYNKFGNEYERDYLLGYN